MRGYIFDRQLGINVVTTHRGEQKFRFKVNDISSDCADTLRFMHGDTEMTITGYFQSQYNFRLLFPQLPLLFKGSSGYVLQCYINCCVIVKLLFQWKFWKSVLLRDIDLA